MLRNIVVYYLLNVGVFAGIILGMSHTRWTVFLPALLVYGLVYRPLLDYGRLSALGVLNEEEEKSVWSKTYFSTISYKYFRPLFFGVKRA
jgi:hypothetical protein